MYCSCMSEQGSSSQKNARLTHLWMLQVRGIVEEREKKLKETMCIMGLQGWVLHAGERSRI